jgi:hypothetical protein
VSEASRENRFDADVDQYLAVGFKYIAIEQHKFDVIRAFEEEHNIKIMYPLIANNEYTYGQDSADAANFWYKTKGKADPIKIIDGVPVIQKYNENLVLEENYMRDSHGNFVYRIYTGGGDSSYSTISRARIIL